MVVIDLYYRFNQASFSTDQDRILTAGMNMGDEAMKWFEPMAKNYLNYVDPNAGTGRLTTCNVDMRRVFSNYSVFEIKMIVVFGEIDEETEVIRKFQQLR